MYTRFLTVLRHAKAGQSSVSGGDMDRPLAKSGYKQLQRVCKLLAAGIETPDWIVSSPALRARQTAEKVAELLGYTRTIGWHERIYAADPFTLLSVLQDMHDTARHVLLIGHNPGVARLVSGLCAGADGRMNLHFPTAGMAHFGLEIARWRQLHWGSSEMRFLIAPRFLKKANRKG